MKLSNLKNIELREVGEWPGIFKALFILICCALVIGGWFYYDIQHQYAELDRQVAQEKHLRKSLEDKQAKVVNLEEYKQQLEEMKKAFGAMLRQLPDKREIAELLVDVSQSGLAAGLEFELFRPEGEVPKEFYVEHPIRLKVVGTYHEFGEFISTLSAMPRIVTIHNVRISRPKRSDSPLRMEAIARTYRYIDEDEAE
ncbi:MAG: type 4a pilus biogenesis protein PilO [Pseudomonadota bacterium]